MDGLRNKTMQLTDVAPVEKWKELEREIHERSGLDAYIYNTKGLSITDFKKWANQLCPAIKGIDKGLSFICAVANQNLANEAIQKKEPVIGECDAGLLKVAVPIFVEDVFVGVAGGCGLILDGSEVESFLINKVTGLEEHRVEHLSEGIVKMATEEVELLIGFIQEKLDGIVGDFLRKQVQ
jgi:ligand-binding sensor protein